MRATCGSLLLACALLTGCGVAKRAIDSVRGTDDLAGPPEIPDHLRARDGGGAAPLTRVRFDDEGTPVGPVSGVIPSADQIEWTDPDDPDAPLEGLEEALAAGQGQKGPWQVSFSEATRLARREGRPLLIWFTDTQRSPLCRSLSAEVFSDAAFETWAREHLVRLRIDFNVKGDSEDDRLRKKDYLEALKKRYKVLGLPTVLVIAPDGTVTGRYKGYRRGEGDFYFGRIKNATLTAEEQTEKWQQAMARKGYRTWVDRRGRKVFARLARYAEGEMILVEPGGKRLRAAEAQLSDADQAWIAAEKARRGR